MKLFFSLLCLMGLLSVPAIAGTGAILPDGVHLVRTDEKSLSVYSLEGKTKAELQWPAESKYEYPVIAIAKECLLVGGENSISSYDPATKTWTPFWASPEGWTVDDIAYDAKNDRIIAVTGDEEGNVVWWVFAEESNVPGKLFNRRAAGAGDPVFDKDGNLYFTVAGDLWKGSIEVGDYKEVPFVLIGDRIWPLAFRETADGNSSGLSARQIVPLEKWIVLELSRAGGSGWGNIIRVPNEDAYEKHLPLKWDELEDCGSGSDAAVSADGKMAFVYVRGAGRWFEIEGGTGDLKPLPAAE